jgi:hypothetical protein
VTHRIIAARPQKATGFPVFAYDTETQGLDATQVLIICAENVNSGEQYTFFDVSEFREFLESKAPCVAYAHNGSSFDVLGILSEMELYSAQKVAAGTKVFEYKVNGVMYRDSKHLIPLPLSKVAKSVNMEKGITPQEYIDGTVTEITQEAIDYCLLDVKILSAALRRLKELYAELVGMDKNDIEMPYTTASMAYRVYCIPGSWPDHWVWQDARKNWRPIARCRDQFNELYRQAQHGGRVQVLGPVAKEVHNVVSYDANSLYPSVMYDEKFPDPTKLSKVGPTMQALRSQLNSEESVVMADLVMFAPEGVPRFLPATDEDGRKKWDNPTFEGWLCEPEIKLALEVGWVIEEVRDIVSARAIRPFREYVSKLYQIRMRMVEEGDPTQYLVKILLNSLYGRWGLRQRPKRIEGDKAIAKATRRKDYTKRFELRFYDGTGFTWPYLLDYGDMGRNPSSQWYGFSSFILSYARERLARAIISVGDGALYCDTDSIHMYAEYAEEFERSTPIGNELSQWKLETPEPIHTSKFWEAKSYVQWNEEGDKTLVKHKGVRVRDDDGNYLPEAGDLTQEQTHRVVVSLYEGLRRGLRPGTPLTVKKRSRRFYKDES